MKLSSETYSSLLAPDAFGMLELVSESPRRGRRNYTLGQAQPWLPGDRELWQILVCGMGGSGSTGDLLQLIADRAGVPVLVNKSVHLPAWVGPHTLVIGVSYSGNTFETLSCLRQAQVQGAALLGLGSGGELASLAAEADFPMLRIEGGLPPRAALFDMLFALLGCLEDLSLLGLNPNEIIEGLNCLDRLSQDWNVLVDGPEPLPLDLARRLIDTEPMLWGGAGGGETVALRWKNQLSENGKILASVSALPELNHNEVVAMCARHHSRRHLLYLTLESAVPAIDGVSIALVAPHLRAAEALAAEGHSRLERLLYLVYLGDFVSVYLALLQGIDPTPIAAIEALKQRMAKLAP